MSKPAAQLQTVLTVTYTVRGPVDIERVHALIDHRFDAWIDSGGLRDCQLEIVELASETFERPR